MSIESFVNRFNAALDESIRKAMEGPVTTAIKGAMVTAIDKEVFLKYSPSEYKRRSKSGAPGGLQDWNVMESNYDPSTMTLEVQNMSRDDESGRLIAPVVEEGVGYQWEDSRIYAKQPFPRPFHKKAQEIAIQTGNVGAALRYQLKEDGFDPK